MISGDLLIFIGLFVISLLVRQGFVRHGHSPAAAGSIVMSLGIFSTFALRQLPFYTPSVGKLMTIEVFIIWLFIAWSFFNAYLRDQFKLRGNLDRRFAVGTWVAGTAVLSALAVDVLPEVRWFGDVLAIGSVVIYIPYLIAFLRDYKIIWQNPKRQAANGVILLATVSTMSVVIAVDTAFGWFSTILEQAIMAFGVALLLTGLVIIAEHYHKLKWQELADKWMNSNCIIHGAVSITGLALTQTAVLSKGSLLTVWYIAAILFIVVEIIEIARAGQRVNRLGLANGLLVYNVSQWTRNFTFGMFYAFTLLLSRLLPENGMLQAVDSVGRYVVLIVLVVEIGLFFKAHMRRVISFHDLENQRSE